MNNTKNTHIKNPPNHSNPLKKSSSCHNQIFSNQIQPQPSLQFSTIISQIYQSEFFNNKSKHIKIKLQAWMNILQKYQFNSVWKTNKLHYLKLLNLMCQCEYLTFPFTSFPKDTHLPILKKHQIDRIIDEVQRQVRLNNSQTNRGKWQESKLFSIKGTVKSKYISSKSQQNTSKPSNQNIIQNKITLNDERSTNNSNDKTRKKAFQTNKDHKNHKIIIKQEEFTVTKSKQIKQKLQNEKTKNNSVKISNFLKMKIENTQEYQPEQNKAIHSNKQRYNSISNSINIQISPISLSSKVWEYTKKKSQGKRTMKQITDFSKFIKTTADSPNINQNGRFSYPAKHYVSLHTNTTKNNRQTKKQYWESNTYTGNGTPKYLNQLENIANLSFTESENLQIFKMQENHCCHCNYQFWSNII